VNTQQRRELYLRFFTAAIAGFTACPSPAFGSSVATVNAAAEVADRAVAHIGARFDCPDMAPAVRSSSPAAGRQLA
jgi:hypothetical protein